VFFAVTEDYPQDQLDFDGRFATDQACREYLEQLRWPEGFVCPRCQQTKAWRDGRGRQMCAGCLYPVSATAGTIFQDTRKPLRLWFRAAWYVTSQKQGASALGLQRVLGLGSYLTAWSWLHKLRRAMVRPGRDALSGAVEVDETYVGGLAEGKRGRGADHKALVVIAAEEDGKGMGRIRMSRVTDASARSLEGFVQSVVVPGSRIHTDGWEGYAGLPALGYAHEVTVLRGLDSSAATTLLPRVHRVASLLKRWLLGIHQGAVRPSHLDYYLDEFTFRFNRRTSRSRGKLFYRLIQQSVQVAPVPYKGMVGGKPLCHPSPQPLGGTVVN
jgi:transposase-like protein